MSRISLSCALLSVLALQLLLPPRSCGEGNRVPSVDDDGVLSKTQDTKTYTHTSIIRQHDLLTCLYLGPVTAWPKRQWLITVVAHAKKNDLTEYHMSFFRQIRQDVFVRLFDYASIDSFQTAFATIEHDRVMTIWTTGSAHRLKIFAVEGKEVREVLAAGWKHDPEFVHLSKDDEPEIVIPRDEFPNQGPDHGPQAADIYKWNGRTYDLIATRPWGQRLAEIGDSGAGSQPSGK